MKFAKSKPSVQKRSEKESGKRKSSGKKRRKNVTSRKNVKSKIKVGKHHPKLDHPTWEE